MEVAVGVPGLAVLVGPGAGVDEAARSTLVAFAMLAVARLSGIKLEVGPGVAMLAVGINPAATDCEIAPTPADSEPQPPEISAKPTTIARILRNPKISCRCGMVDASVSPVFGTL